MSPSRAQGLRSLVGQRFIDSALDIQHSRSRRHVGQFALAATRRALLGERDPVITRQVGDVTIAMPLSHRLPDYLARYQNYGANLVRLSKFLAEREPDLTIIDVGANVGDTVAQLRTVTSAPVLCVEADDRYFSLLEVNAPVLGDVVCVQTFLGRSASVIAGAIARAGGTGHLVAGDSAIALEPLDEVVARTPGFERARLLKIDVDGVDFEVLAGATALLRRARPVLFLEYDPTLVAAQGFDARASLDWLRDVGYGSFVAYDNVGDMALTGSLDDARLLDDLHDYVAAKRSMMFWDLAVFHRSDEALFVTFASSERAVRESMTTQIERGDSVR